MRVVQQRRITGMPIILDGNSLTIEDVVAVARHGEKVDLAAQAVADIERCRAMLERKIEARETMYGINTGIGELSEVVLDDDQVQDFQKYLIYNHAAGIGEPFPVDVVRAAMLGRINVQSKGLSGCRLVIPRTYVAMLNAGVTPVACSKGSVGACGDLAPMAQIAQSLMGEGEAFYEGQRMPAAEAMQKAGIPIPGLKARDGFHGAVTCSANLLKVLSGSDLVEGKLKVKVQDAYSMRSTPQVIGALRDFASYTRRQVEIELNGAADNPIFLPDDDQVLTGANFQGTPVSMPLDMLAAGITMVSVLSERRLNRLLHPALSVGLPAFLTRGAGMFSGLMLSQYTADMLIVEQRILSAPSCVQSIPAAADQEDFVSMGMNGALKSRQILENAHGVLGIEAIAAAQALDFRDHALGRGTRSAHAAVRRVVEHLETDRPLHTDHNAMAAAVERGEMLDAVENDIGALTSSW
jgi:histidine ammonia-lyase